MPAPAPEQASFNAVGVDTRAGFRSGHLAAADEVLRSAEAGSDVTATGTAAFYRAMCLFQQGKKDKVREVSPKAAAAIKPFPEDEQGPLAGEVDRDNLILWLACGEAKAMSRCSAGRCPARRTTPTLNRSHPRKPRR